MNRNRKDVIFVIKTINYSEADKILIVFGENRGKFSIAAKGVRKITSKNRGNIQTFSISKISYYQGEGLPILMETEEVSVLDYANIDTKNLERVLFILNKLLPEETPNKKIFDSLFHVINQEVKIDVVNKFRMLFLKEEGMIPDFKICSKCNETNEKMYLDMISFTGVCENCKKEFSDLIYQSKDIYLDNKFTNALDRYIQRVYTEIA